MKKILLFTLGLVLNSLAYGQVFQQDFGTLTTVASYVNATSPGSDKFNRIENLANHPSSIVGGKLRFAKSSSNGSANFTRYTEVSTDPTFLQVKFKYELVANGSTSGSSQSKFFVGGDFPINGADPEIAFGTSIYSSFDFYYSGINGGFKVGSGTTLSQQYTGQQEITLVINNTGNTVSYLGPDAEQNTVLNDNWDLWVGTDKVLAGMAAQSPLASINKFMFFARYNGLAATYEFDDFEIHDNTTLTLPVTFTSFVATKKFNSTVSIKWATASEKNNSHFELYRSDNGQNFNLLGSVNSKNDEDYVGRTVYSFEDLSPDTGDNYYKICQVDKDGTKYSFPKIVSIKWGVPVAQIKVLDTNGKVDMIVVPSKKGLDELMIIDMSGKLVVAEKVYLQEGENRFSLQKDLIPGVYFVYLRNSDKTLNAKFLK